MRCDFKETACPNGSQFICFTCSTCGKQLSVATALRPRLADVLRQMPDCGKPLPAPTEQAAAEPATPEFDPTGPGAQLKRFLSRLGIKSTPTCSCNARARKMDEMGVEWCQENINEIVGWLKEEAGKRNLPFLSYPTKIVVQRAINLARKARDEKLAAEKTDAPAAT